MSIGNQQEKNEYFLALLSIPVLLFAFAVPFTYWKNAPHITLDKYTIKIGKDLFHLNQIKDIVLTGKIPFKFFITQPLEGMVILFEDGTEKYLFDDFYFNSTEIKTFLEQVVLNKQDFKVTTISKVSKVEIRFEKEEVFKGKQFTSFRGISLWVLIGFIAYLAISNQQYPPNLILLGIVVFWFLLNSWLMHYFGLTKDHLIIRNHNFIWMTKIYKLTDIKEVVYESQGRQPNCMRIIFKDFKNKFYPAGTLRDKTWIELKKKLELKGIRVRNECI